MGAQPAYTLEAQPRNDSLAPQNMAKPPKQEPQAPSGKGVGAVERVEETSQEKAQRTQREDALLAQARAIRKSRDKKVLRGTAGGSLGEFVRILLMRGFQSC